MSRPFSELHDKVMADPARAARVDAHKARMADELEAHRLTFTNDDVWPRDDPDYRYRLYQRVGDDLTVLVASPDMAGIGLAIGTLNDDAREAGTRLCDQGRLGILDVVGGTGPRGEWIMPPWDRGDGKQ